MNVLNERPWCFVATWLLAWGLSPSFVRGQHNDFLGLSDLEEYRDALMTDAGGRPLVVTFHDLWQHPDDFRGQTVRIEGRVERRFRQPPVGEFPALSELWIVDDAGNPFCIVTPASEIGVPGQLIRFDGQFLRRIRYRGADADRLAPLVVGPSPPRLLGEAVPGAAEVPGDLEWVEGWIAGILATVVVVILGLQHLRRHSPARPAYQGPAPEFLGPDKPPSGAADDAEGSHP